MSLISAGQSGKATRVFLVAGEESGDQLGAVLIRALRRRNPDFQVSGVGGNAMAAEGLSSLFPIDNLSLIGLSTIFRRAPALWSHIRETAAAAIAARPDVVVIIDCPEFSHRVARRIRAVAPGIPIVDYVSPSVWAWRSGRARRMTAYIDHVLCVFPFEPDVHRRLGGPPATYVGHPLADKLSLLRPNDSEQRRRIAAPPILLVLPGSRPPEIRRMMESFGGAIERVHAAVGTLELVLPTVPQLVGMIEKAVAGWPVRPRLVTDEAEKYAAFRSARAALIKSGTVTLELALAGIPMVTGYKVSALDSFMVRQMIQLHLFTLPNLILRDTAVPEFFQERCTPQTLADALIPLMSESPARREQLAAFSRLAEVMETGKAPSGERAAELVLAYARGGRQSSAPKA